MKTNVRARDISSAASGSPTSCDTALITRFEALWSRCVPAAAVAAPTVARELMRLYSEPERRFHNVGHISDCLRYLDEVRSFVRAPDTLELALWFHDAIYSPGAPDNEERSVELFRSLSQKADPVFVKRVGELIMATKHGAKVNTGDRGFIVDIDLAGFGVGWDEFMRKGAELRDEYATQSDDEYYRGQVSFLTRLKARPTFYCTRYFRTRYEDAAQENLSRLIELRLQQGYRAPQ